MDAWNQGVAGANAGGNGENSGTGGVNTGDAGNPWGNSNGNVGGGLSGGAQAEDPCAANFYMNGYSMTCGCSGYTWSTSGNKCVPGGGNAADNSGGDANDNSGGNNGGTPAGFTGWGGDNEGSGGTKTPASGLGTSGNQPHAVCDPPTTYDASCDCCVCPGGHPDMFGQGCDYWEGSSR